MLKKRRQIASKTSLILQTEEVGVDVVGAFFSYGFGPADNYVDQLEQRGSKKMKFEDLKFTETTVPDGIQSILKFANDYELSIVKNEVSYGNKQGLYEIAVFKGNEQVTLPGITEDHDTVKGFLSPEEVVGIIKKMHLVTGSDPEQV